MKNFKFRASLFRFRALTLIVFFTHPVGNFAQQPKPDADALFLEKIYNRALTDSRCYNWLEHLSLKIGHRLSGSPAAEKAVVWTRSVLDTLGLDSVWLQPCMVPHWVRGQAEQVRVTGSRTQGAFNLPALALGGSVGGYLKADVVEVTSWDQLEELGTKTLRGKIVFYNRPMDPAQIRTFDAYRIAVDQRVSGATRAARYGAVGVLVRSMSLRLDDFPHTGSLHYDTAYTKIPAAAISTNAAERLGNLLKKEGRATVSMRLNCRTLPDAPSYNVIGEIRGSERPGEMIIVGGHLDSWDVGQGAHDDGAGTMQSMEVLRLLKKLGYQPRHTIRCVLFMNEENGLRGGQKYAEEARRKGEYHLAAIESDAGGFTPRGFSFDGDGSVFAAFYEKVKSLEPYFSSYGLQFTKGGSGADIGPLKDLKGLLSGYAPDSQRYFDYHHSADDTFDKVNKRELELGAASMAALVYLLDKYGL
jgi:hypothetical protein